MALTKTNIFGIVLALVVFVLLLVPYIAIVLKRFYFRVNKITLNTHRRLYFSLLYGLCLTIPSIIFVINDIRKGNHPVAAFIKKYLPLAAYVITPIILSWLRPLAATPLDLWDILLILGLVIPVILQVAVGSVHIFFDEAYPSKYLWIDFHSLYIIAGTLAVFIYSVLRPLPDIGLGSEMRLPTIWDGVLTILATVLLIASLPLLIFTDHSFDRHTNIPAIWIFVNFICVFVFVALPLELVFRGVIQNLLHARIEVYRDVRQYTTTLQQRVKDRNYQKQGTLLELSLPSPAQRNTHSTTINKDGSRSLRRPNDEQRQALANYAENNDDSINNELGHSHDDYQPTNKNSGGNTTFINQNQFDNRVYNKNQDIDEFYNDNNTHHYHNHQDTISQVGHNKTNSVIYSISSKKGAMGNGLDIRDTTSTSLGIGYVSIQDAEIARTLAREDQLASINDNQHHDHNEFDDIENGHERGHGGILTHIPRKLTEIDFDEDAFKSRQRGYGFTTFEESPKWPTWQERHHAFYRRGFLWWFLLPTKTDYVCTFISSLIYAGALLYNVAYFIQYNDAGQKYQNLKSITWFTLFFVLFWQGVLSGFLWRMSSQIWPSVLLSAVFFTLAAFWLGVDGA